MTGRGGCNPYVKYLAALLLYGSTGVVASRIHLSSYEIVFLRTLLGSAFLLLVFLLSGHRFTFLRHKRDALFVAASGVAMAAEWLLLFEAYARIGVSLGILINYCGPAIVVALSPVLFKERVTASRLAALGAAMLGALLISGQAAAGGADALGLVCAGLSAVGYAAMVIFDKLSREVTGMENSALQLVSAFVAITMFTVCRGGGGITVPGADWPAILILGVFNTGVACWFFFSSVGRLPAQTVAVCGYLEPLSAVLFSVLLLGEALSPWQTLGALMILGGAVLGECAGSRRKRLKANA